MNIYLMTEDGVTFCIRARSMREAAEICEDAYICQVKTEPGFDGEFERTHYREKILLSCQLVGELRN